MYEPFEGSLEEHPHMVEAIRQYEDALRRVAEGTFPVKLGGVVFRVINGIRIGSSTPHLEPGNTVEANSATPHYECVIGLIQQNDRYQYYFDNDPFDRSQQIACIRVDAFTIPKPDLTYSAADQDQVLVTGEVLEVLTPNEFIDKYSPDQ